MTARVTARAAASPAEALAHLHRLMSGLTAGLDLAETLTAVVECVVAGLGYGVGVIAMVEADGDLVVTAVAGDPDARAALDGMRSTRAEWDRLLGLGEPVGPGGLLRLLDHTREGVWNEEAMPTWEPESSPEVTVAADGRPSGIRWTHCSRRCCPRPPACSGC